MDDQIDGGDEGFQAVGLAVAFDFEGEAGVAVLGEEDRRGLEGPTDVGVLGFDGGG